MNSCHWCGETDQRKLKPSTNYEGSRIIRCIKAWECHLRRLATR